MWNGNYQARPIGARSRTCECHQFNVANFLDLSTHRIEKKETRVCQKYTASATHPMRPAHAATVLSEWSESCATTVMN